MKISYYKNLSEKIQKVIWILNKMSGDMTSLKQKFKWKERLQIKDNVNMDTKIRDIG